MINLSLIISCEPQAFKLAVVKLILNTESIVSVQPV